MAMRVPRVRITVRRMMLVVAVLALPMSFIHLVLNAREGGEYPAASANSSSMASPSSDTRRARVHSLRPSAWIEPGGGCTVGVRRCCDCGSKTRSRTGTTTSSPGTTPPTPRSRSYDTHAHFYWCPSGDSRTTKETDYVAVVGPHTAWPGDTGRRLVEITDERAARSYSSKSPPPASTGWSRGTRRWRSISLLDRAAIDSAFFFALFADFHVEKVRKDVDRATLEALLTIDGGEMFDPRSWQLGD